LNPLPQVQQTQVPYDMNLKYEMTDHLGNVSTVVTARLLPGDDAPHEAFVIQAQGYEPFGSLLPGRNYSSDSYRFGFNGMPKDDEINGATGTSYDFGARLYDPRVSRFLSLDPKAHSYPWQSPYAFAMNSPISFVDENGEGPDKVTNNSTTAVIVITGSGYIINAQGVKTEYRDKIYLSPGDVFVELSEVTRADGSKISRAEIRRASGVVETTIIDDIDFIDVQPGQTMVIHNMILSDEQVTDASPDFQGPTIMAPAQEDLTAPQPSQQGHYTQTPNNGEIKVGNAMSTLTFSDQVDDKNKPTGAIQIDNTGPGDPETP